MKSIICLVINNSENGKHMKTTKLITLLILILFIKIDTAAQVYPPDEQLTFQAKPSAGNKPAYLTPITDPTYKSKVVRITDQAVFDSKTPGMGTYHHYSKDQAWNSDGSLILLEGWPSAIIDGKTYEYKKFVNPPGGPHTWSNTQPDIIYGTNNSNSIVKLNVSTNTTSIVRTFTEYTFVSYGEWEGNMSNDDRYMVLQCKTAAGEMAIVVYDLVDDAVVSTMSAPVWPNNCAMSQSGKYVEVQWDVAGYENYQGICIYNRSDLSFVRNVISSGGGHYDFGYDTEGNEVCTGADIDGSSRGIIMVRLDNGAKTYLLSDAQMSWPIHISCRNLNRAGWAYLTEFAETYGEPTKPNFQKMFAVKLDPTANNDAVTETFAHVQHSTTIDYDRSPFGVPNRDGSKVMFRSDWMKGTGEINSYVATMPQPGDDNTPPTVPTGLVPSNIALTSFDLSWVASSDSAGVNGYEVFKSGISIGTTTDTSMHISGLKCNSSYSMKVKAFDAAGNMSAASTTLAVSTISTCDIIAPGVPVGLHYSNLAPNSFTLSWNTSTDNYGVTGYDVFKDGVFYGSATSDTTLNIEGLDPNTVYSMTVKAKDASGNISDASAPLLVTTGSCTLPHGWTGVNIGATGQSSCEDAGTFTIVATGADIWGTTDEFMYTYKNLTGDGVITAKVDSITNTNIWAKSGVMIRESLAADSKHVDCHVTAGNGISFQLRSTTGGNTTSTIASGISAPYWVKLERIGNIFNAYHSPDGAAWTQVGSGTTVSMASNVYIGLAVTSHVAGTYCTSMISDVVTGGGINTSIPGAPIPANEVSCFPNPVNSELSIKNIPQIADVSVFTVDGRLVTRVKTKNNSPFVLDVSSWKNGIYCICIKSKNESITRKVTVQH